MGSSFTTGVGVGGGNVAVGTGVSVGVGTGVSVAIGLGVAAGFAVSVGTISSSMPEHPTSTSITTNKTTIFFFISDSFL